jgi:pimeloyl-ACP methyl ester carboxylesterase
MTLPGVGFGDEAMILVRHHLRKLGFETHRWQLGLNLGSVPRTIPKVAERVRELRDQTGQPVALVGWSLGGYLAREVARESPQDVSHVVTLGTPIRGGPKYTVFSKLYALGGMDLDAIEAMIEARESTPIQVPISCLYSKNDGVADWRAVVDFASPRVERIEVDATHSAMSFDPIVLNHIGRALLSSIVD